MDFSEFIDGVATRLNVTKILYGRKHSRALANTRKSIPEAAAETLSVVSKARPRRTIHNAGIDRGNRNGTKSAPTADHSAIPLGKNIFLQRLNLKIIRLYGDI